MAKRRGRTGSVTPSTGGFALLLVLWFLVLIAAIGAYMVANARSEVALAHNVLAAAKAEALADAAVAQAAFNLNDPDVHKHWKLDGTTYAIKLPGGQATIRLEDERSKINLNIAHEHLLAALFQALGVDSELSLRLGACIGDWVNKGAHPRPLGAKADEYKAAGRSYGPPGDRILNIDELQLVLGMTPKILASAAPYLTVYTLDTIPLHLKTAGKPVLLALDAVAKDPEAQAQAQLSIPRPPAPAEPNRPKVGQPSNAPPADTDIVTVIATATGTDGGTYARRAVIHLDPTTPKGYDVLDWQRAILPN